MNGQVKNQMVAGKLLVKKQGARRHPIKSLMKFAPFRDVIKKLDQKQNRFARFIIIESGETA